MFVYDQDVQFKPVSQQNGNGKFGNRFYFDLF